MIYISIQPDIHYFHWQVEAYLFNFLDKGIKDIHVVFLYQQSPSDKGLRLKEKYPQVNFFFYKDERKDKSYIPSIKPWGMFRHLQEYPLLNKENILFYHDSDIIFREKVNESLFTQDNKWYLSNTVSYIGYNYCISKGLDQFHAMTKVIGIDPERVRVNQANSGGAQYVVKNTGWEFWYKVYDDSNKLYRFLEIESIKWKSKEHPIQKWCAEMWATLWNIWLFNYETVVHQELNFCFATAPIEDWYKCKIMHNAGVTEIECDQMFFKGNYIEKDPIQYLSIMKYSDKFCSWMYVKNLKKLQKSFEN